jgi:DNA-directed RNA polymerase II subunit RPB2
METKPKLDDEYDFDAGAGILSSEDLWTVISSFFSDQGLVNQQLSSYNQFMETTMQAIMMEHGDMTLDQIAQHSGAGLDQTVGGRRTELVGCHNPTSDSLVIHSQRRFKIKFEQVYLGPTNRREGFEGNAEAVTPQEARLRNAT